MAEKGVEEQVLAMERLRNDRYIAPIIKRSPAAFRLGDITENYENPVRQAEYLYSLIESEVK